MKSAAILAPKKAMNSGSVLVQCPGVVVLDSRTLGFLLLLQGSILNFLFLCHRESWNSRRSRFAGHLHFRLFCDFHSRVAEGSTFDLKQMFCPLMEGLQRVM
jgi:hypothetical protein